MTPSPLRFANESAQIDCSLSAHQFEEIRGGVSGGGTILQERQFASLNLPGNEAESNLRRTTAPFLACEQQRVDVFETAEDDVEVSLEIDLEVMNKRLTAPTLEVIAFSALCVPEG